MRRIYHTLARIERFRADRSFHHTQVGRIVLQPDRQRYDALGSLAFAIANAFSIPSADSRIGMIQIGRVIP